MTAQSKSAGTRDLDGLLLKTLHYNALANYGLLTRAAIAEMSERDLLRVPRLGAAAIAAIKRELARHGLALRSEPTPHRAGARRRWTRSVGTSLRT
jgi:DNA-directed RNA polymerase alpha subunit